MGFYSNFRAGLLLSKLPRFQAGLGELRFHALIVGFGLELFSVPI